MTQSEIYNKKEIIFLDNTEKLKIHSIENMSSYTLQS